MPAKHPKGKRVTVSEVKKIARNEVRGEAEVKFLENRYLCSADFAGQNANTLKRLSGVAQGNSDSTRVGDEVKPVSIRVKLWAQNLTGALADDAVVRVILFQWHNDSGRDPPSIDEILMSTATGSVYAPLSELIHDQRKQFSLIDQKTFVMAAGSTRTRYVTLANKRPMRRIQFRGGGIEGNEHIYMLCLSQFSTLTSEPGLTISSRLNYTDI